VVSLWTLVASRGKLLADQDPAAHVVKDRAVCCHQGEDLVITAPAGSPPPGPQDLLGRRIAVAVIDLPCWPDCW
jgi:hypothetical protein